MENKNYLSVSECFYSIQGEGRTTGTPAVFLRLSGCNLLCKSAEWVCDSIDVWRTGVKIDFDKIFDEKMIEAFYKGAHLVLTGGEPALHQKQIFRFLIWFKNEHGFLPYIEIETNGTIYLSDDFFEILDQINCSYKLANSGEPFKKRIKMKSLKRISSHKNYFFKFVINKDLDMEETLETLGEVYEGFIIKSNVYLMPAGEDQAELSKTRPIVADLCKKHFFNYTERSHIVIWNKKTGV
jgi:organic radical activating enzyme